MNIDNLIEKLKEIKEKHGNLPVSFAQGALTCDIEKIGVHEVLQPPFDESNLKYIENVILSHKKFSYEEMSPLVAGLLYNE